MRTRRVLARGAATGATTTAAAAAAAASVTTAASTVVCTSPSHRWCLGGYEGVRGAFRTTRLLRAEKRRFSGFEAVELKVSRARLQETDFGSPTLELNLLEDPTAGLATGPAEELTPTELETRVRVLVSSYAPALYRLLYTPFIDVVGVLVREQLVPDASEAPRTIHAVAGDTAGAAEAVATSARPTRPEEVMARWFADGTTTLKHPHRTAEAMGKRRWTHFSRALEAHWDAMEPVMPLTRVVRRANLREDLYLPLFRQLTMELADPTKRTAAVATLPGFVLCLANGRAPRSLGLPEDDAARVQLVSDLFLGVAQETGDTDLAYLALQLLRANNMPTPFAAQKQLTNVFATASRIVTDWQMRGSSLLVESYRKWLEYFRAVQLDNKAALEKLEAADGTEGAGATPDTSTPAKAKGERSDKNPTATSTAPTATATASQENDDAESVEQYRYFTSRQQDDITRITALEANIEDAVRGRAAELRGLRERRRWRRKGQSQTTTAASEESVAAAAVAGPPAGENRPTRSRTRSAPQQSRKEAEVDASGDATENHAEEAASASEGARAVTVSSRRSRRRGPHKKHHAKATIAGEGGAERTDRSTRSTTNKEAAKTRSAAGNSVLSF